jgi:hypothetical protein
MAVNELFEHRGRTWRRITHDAVEKFGVDLGQVQDNTAICVMRYSKTPLETFKTKRSRMNNCAHVVEQDIEVRYDVVHLQRVPLGTDYVEVAQHVKELLERPPLNDHDNVSLVIDETGVGRVVGDILVKAGLSPIRVTITAGNEQKRGEGHCRYNVSKTILVSGVDAMLNTGQLRFAEALLDAPALKNELANFQRHVGAANRASYGARVGQHDDLVLAVALATWRAMGNGPGEVYWGTVRGMH